MYSKSRKFLLLIVTVLWLMPIKPSAQLTYYLEPTAIECPKLNQILYTMDTCLYIYNTYSNYTEHVRVIYDPSVATANAGYKGRIAFGGSAGSKTGTHEMQHVLGIGTYSAWNKNRDKDKKEWLGSKAIAQLKEFDGLSAVLKADQSHFWPYGINTKWDDTHHHVYMVGALREDMGLSNTSGQGTGVYCNPPTIIPRTKTNDKTILSTFAFASLGDAVTLMPDDIKGATWSWKGPDNFVSDERVVSFSDVQSSRGGIYTVTCINACGESSSREFNIIIGEGKSYYVIENMDTKWWLRPQTNQVGSQMVGVTPDQSDLFTHWEKIDTDNGWFYLKNRATGMYFRPLSEEQPARMEQVETSNTGIRVQWRFVGTENGYGHLMNREYYRKIKIVSNSISNNYIEQTGAGSAGSWTQWAIKVIDQNTTANKPAGVFSNPMTVYANPARETVVVKYSLQQSSTVTLKVYNTLGREVKILADSNAYPAGNYTFEWNRTGANGISTSSGSVYIVRLTVDNQTFSSKVVVLD
jgi:hypothetical protein